MAKYIFLGSRKPTQDEKKKGAEVVFMYEQSGQTINVLGAKCHESWEQWGAIPEVLSLNVDRIEKWRMKR